MIFKKFKPKISPRALCGTTLRILKNSLLRESPHKRGARWHQICSIGLRSALLSGVGEVQISVAWLLEL